MNVFNFRFDLICPNGKLDPENIGIAVGISLISSLGAGIHAFEVWRPPSWIFLLPVRSHSIPISPSGMLDLKNVGLGSAIYRVSPLSDRAANKI